MLKTIQTGEWNGVPIVRRQTVAESLIETLDENDKKRKSRRPVEFNPLREIEKDNVDASNERYNNE